MALWGGRFTQAPKRQTVGSNHSTIPYVLIIDWLSKILLDQSLGQKPWSPSMS
ncbi:Uncharacterised protein [Vibrio cholerae]|nr:Uncharacterised protein [Vibrio cholerae]